MSVNTSALVPAAPKSGKQADGTAGERSQTSAKDAATAFQSVLQGMKRGEAPVDEAGENGRQSAGGNPQHGNGDALQDDPGNRTTGDNANVADRNAFATTNLVDALRQVSHNVLAKFSANGTDGESGEAASEQGGGQTGSGQAIPAALSLEAVLVPKPGQVPPGARSVQGAAEVPLQSPMPGGDVRELSGKDGALKTGASSLFAQFGVEPESVSEPLTNGGHRSLLPEEAAGTVKILRQETHFAPNMRLSPAQQVGDQIATALKSLASENSAPVQNGLTHRAEGPVVKTLDIQLTPHELGSVKVSLRMVGDTVEVTLQTSKAQTADLLKQDRQLLDQMLKATGFKPDTITIQAADDRGTVQAGSSANGNSTMGQNTSGNSAFNDGQPQNSGGGNSGQQQGRPGRNPGDDTYSASEALRGQAHEDDTGNSLSDGIYL